jgi:hypothetical protein
MFKHKQVSKFLGAEERNTLDIDFKTDLSALNFII